VQILSTLPFKALSYYWGRFNEIPLPRILRAPGFKLYSYIFGVNLDEVAEPPDHYRNLAEFFYRQLKPGCRPIDPRPNAVVSPADGKVLQFGEVRSGGEVEQVKGMAYSLDALLGTQGEPVHSEGTSPNAATLVKKKLEGKGVEPGQTTARYGKGGDSDQNAAVYTSDEEFANVNGISYTLPSLLSGSSSSSTQPNNGSDVSVPASASDTLEVGTEVARATASSWFTATPQKRLFFCVIYLAPGDYHRFHSPVSWVVERRRHFAGELYSVSPWLQSRLKDLFILNERVVLLGRWRYGMFSMTPVGATNVGSIKIHFDRELRTNSLTHDATKASEKGGFVEATYKGASALLGGYPITKGGEIGGFNLGSTVVLVFEAPASDPNGPPGQGGFRFCVKRGQKVKMGEALGVVDD
jgi:phosphatidylserine decarboxylase